MYGKKDANLVEATISIATLDTFMALLAGLAIFPAVFAMGLNPGEGAGLADPLPYLPKTLFLRLF
jgi:NSS family neurotransmitter:Na+ symporter